MNKVYLQYWEESERGWGIRPDGCSLHIDLNSHHSYIKNYLQDRDPNNVPHEYDRIVGDPIEVIVSDAIFVEVKNMGSIRLMQTSLSNLKRLKEIEPIFEDEPFI